MLCLNWLEKQSLEGKTVIDFGCGSGILGIAALLLGAEKVWAIDNDPQALLASRDNAQRNGIPDERLITLLQKKYPPRPKRILW
jgi:ribosomal protein L11 methyltransferase